MRRGAKPPKTKSEAKLPVAKSLRNNESSRVRDLEKRLVEALKREAEALGELPPIKYRQRHAELAGPLARLQVPRRLEAVRNVGDALWIRGET